MIAIGDISVKDPRIKLFEELLASIKEDRPQQPHKITKVPVSQYHDNDWYKHEKETVFNSSPIIVGVSSMIPNAGDHFTHDHLGQPLLIVRGKDLKVRCFLNVCRHRGVRLSNANLKENSKTFSCPYHHWTYNLNGDLIFVPSEDGFPNIDKTCYGLKELPIANKYGLLWVKPNGGPDIDVDNLLGNIAIDLEEFGLSSSHFFRQSVHDNTANWKLHIEAFQDSYHVTRLHNKSVGGFFEDNMAVQERERDNIRSLVARKGIMDVLNAPQSEWDLRNHGSFSHLIWPNTIIVIHPDYISQVTFYPSAYNRTTIVHNCVTNEEPLTKKAFDHYERSFQLIDNSVFSAEDFYVCQQAQKGIESGANDYFTLGGYEQGLRQFHEILYEKTGPYAPNANNILSSTYNK